MDADYRPFRQPLAPGRARAIPWLSVVAGSLLATLPLVVTIPILPPFGLLMLLAWRLIAPFALRRWAAGPLGLFDDLVSGQPLGSAVLLWSLCFLAIELVEQRLLFREFWQDWLIAAGAAAFCLIAGRFIAVPLAAHVDAIVGVQAAATALLFPVAARLVAWIDAKRGMV
ncbi:rod shape-determining protein MreD [Sphingomonas bacterium]|uniref:rod shape-determining protein MreD n=1 Tax=Sphingomonas bacterium TaxID=1895847 RepID=UPI00157623F1|nr:rod shape-determining protein MreD [Sphingomonas bacterium]